MTYEDRNWPRASDWLAGPRRRRRRGEPTLAVCGVPMNSSATAGGCDLAPAAIREALHHYSLYDSDAKVDISAVRAVDAGDREIRDARPEATFEATRDFIAQASADASCTVLLGGDKGVTRPGVHALRVPLERVGLITFGAHHDLRDLDKGLMNGNPIRALLRDGVRGENIVQIGVQPFANSPAYSAIACDAGIECITADEVYAAGIDTVVRQALGTFSHTVEAIYVDLDFDVLDRAFAPACSGSRPGGLQPWMMGRAARMCGADERVKIMDLVEIDPTKDIADGTCLAAASFLLAFAAGIALRSK